MLLNKITSLTNKKVKYVVQLRKSKERLLSGLTIVEGTREVNLAIEMKVPIKEIYFCPEIISKNSDNAFMEKLEALKKPMYETKSDVFTKISYGDRQEGVLVVCEPKVKTFKDLLQKRDPLFVVVESVEKPGNLGAILRTCDGAGVDAVIVCDPKTDIYNPNVVRASLGTIFSNNVVQAESQATVDFLKAQKIKIFAALPQADTFYTKKKMTGAVALVLGSEQKGLSAVWDKNVSEHLKIPMKGKADSLNVSTSAAILIYEAIRQRF